MAVQAKIKMIPSVHQSDSGYSAPQNSSATFIEGAPVKLTSGELVAVSTTNKSSTTHVAIASTSNILGISGGKAVNSVTTPLLVHKIQEGMEFIGNLVHTSGAASAKVSKLGSAVYLAKDKSSDTHWGWSLTAPSSSGSAVGGKIVRLIDPASTLNGRVQVQVTKGGALSAF